MASAITSMIGLQNFPNLTFIEVSYHALQSFNVSGLSNLTQLNVSANDDIFGLGIDNLNISGCPVLQFVNANNNNLPQTNVDNILVTLDNNGVLSGQLFLSGGTNAAPSGTGSAAATSLQGKGWTVFTN